MSKYDAAIDKGIALLDERVPTWCTKMQLDHLDLKSPDSCVLGQVYGSFGQGWDALGFDFPGEYGFDADDGMSYDGLTRRWKQRIRKHCEAHS